MFCFESYCDFCCNWLLLWLVYGICAGYNTVWMLTQNQFSRECKGTYCFWNQYIVACTFPYSVPFPLYWFVFSCNSETNLQHKWCNYEFDLWSCDFCCCTHKCYWRLGVVHHLLSEFPRFELHCSTELSYACF